MSKLSKNTGLCGASILIALDLWVLFGCFKLRGIGLFNEVLDNMIPCGLLLGIFAFCALFEKPVAIKLGYASVVVFCIAAILRFVSGIIYLLDIIKFMDQTGESIESLLKSEGIAILEFFAFVPLVISAILLVFHVLKNKMKKATQIVGGISILALVIAWCTKVYDLVSFGMAEAQSFTEIYFNIFKAGLVWDILIFVGYALILGSLTGALESKKE